MPSKTTSSPVIAGPWSLAQIETFLHESTIPVRLSCVAADGYPRVISLWSQFNTGALYCVTHQDSKLVKMLKGNARVGFEVSADSPPYHGIRGQGNAVLKTLGEDPALEQLLTRYVGNIDSDFSCWLLSRSKEELLLIVNPCRLYSWDYRERMSGTL